MNFKKLALNYRLQRLKAFPEEIFKIPRVYKLDLSGNDIKDIPKEISNLKYLEMLDLGSNCIRHLKAKLFDLPNLKILILKDNQIITIPRQVEKLSQLKVLNLANNNLSELPFELTHLKTLEELNLSGNLLDTIPLHLGQRYFNLKALWLGSNPLRQFTSSCLLEGTMNLKSFYCYSPKLERPVLSEDPIIAKASRTRGNFLPTLKEMLIKKAPTTNMKDIMLNDARPEIPKKPGKIFISYSHKDKEYMERLQVHLKVLGRHIPLDTWTDTRIRSSEKWKEEIEKALNEATNAILLISTDFLASDFIHDNELPPLLKAAEQKGTRIHPVVVHPCQFLKTKSLSQFESVNSPDEAISELTYPKQERIWGKLCDDIQYYLER